MQRILILGAGFAGFPTARRLTKRLKNQAQVTLVDPKDHFLFSPRLIDALDGSVEQSLLTAPLAEHANADGWTFIQGLATRINHTTKTVTIQTVGKTLELPYDILVISSGAKTATYKIPGVEQHAFGLKSVHDVSAIHVRVNELIELADQQYQSQKTVQPGVLNFVTVGGGPSGIEGALALKDYAVDRIQKKNPALLSHLTMTLLNGAPQILSGFRLPIPLIATKLLTKAGVNVRVQQVITEVAHDHVRTSAKETLPTQLVLWCAGIEPNNILIEPDVQRDPRGSLVTDHFFRIEPSIFAAGDVIQYAEKNVIIPKNAQTALHMSESLIENIARTVHHQPLKPFHYHSLGNLLVIGKTGIFEFRGFHFTSPLVVKLRDFLYRLRMQQILK